MKTCGQGYGRLKKFLLLMNLRRPMTVNNYDKIVGKLVNVVKAMADKTLEDACCELLGDDDGIKASAVSRDGLWQRIG